MFQTISISKLHYEYRLWINELNFRKEEIALFERQLEDIICNNRSIEVASLVEHFQNQFICHREVIDELKHDLNITEKQLAAFARQLSGDGLMNIKMDNHTNLRDEVLVQRRIFDDLKKEFRNFQSSYGYDTYIRQQ